MSTSWNKDELHPHALRHLFGAELAEDDVDLLLRQLLLGHADASSAEIYSHLAIRKLTRTTDKANPLAKMKTPASKLLEQLRGKWQAAFEFYLINTSYIKGICVSMIEGVATRSRWFRKLTLKTG